jgi:hypothetical protein
VKATKAKKVEESETLEDKLDKVTAAPSAMPMKEYVMLQYKMSRMESKHTELQHPFRISEPQLVDF